MCVCSEWGSAFHHGARAGRGCARAHSHPLLGAATKIVLGLAVGLLLLGNLGGLPANLASASKRAVHLACAKETENQVEGGLLLDVIVAQGAPVLQLLACKDEALLIGGDACKKNMKGLWRIE